MKKLLRLSVIPALVMPAACAAQNPGDAPPDPKTKAHEVLHKFVGTWDCKVKMSLPDMPAIEMTGIERFELLCDGLWLRSVVDATAAGRPFHAVSLIGFDPKAKTYVAVWTDSAQPTATRSVATYDAKNGTWSSKTVTGRPSRNVLIWNDADTMVETSYVQAPTGKEDVAMEITRTRRKADAKTATDAASGTFAGEAIPADGTAAAASPHRAGMAELYKQVGTWTFVLTMPQPSGQASEANGTEVNSAVCGGGWVWSDFTTTMMGAPFQGHSLAGFDPDRGQYVTYWVDSSSPFLTELTGTLDPETKTLTCTGTAYDPAGKEAPMTQTVTWSDDHARVAKFQFGPPEGGTSMVIRYRRVPQEGGYKIK